VGVAAWIGSNGARGATLSKVASTRLNELACADTEAVLARLETCSEGLLDSEVAARLHQHGHNVVAHEKQKSIPMQLLERFWNPLNLLLMALAGISAAMGDWESTVIIAMMVLLSVSLSFLQEYRSSNAVEKLRAMVSITATVLRRADPEESLPQTDEEKDGRPSTPLSDSRNVPIDQLVPGDVITLSAGDMVPADIRIISAKDLFVNQSALTGEALPVEKFPQPASAGSANPLELHNLCFMGSNVISGSATAVVAMTGASTYFGALASTLTSQRAPTSFDRGISSFTWLMLRFMLVMVPLVFFINGFSKGNWLEAFTFALAVAVGLTPEMLPMIVTINLAKGALAMARKKVIVKRLNAIQNFGAMDVLCTDKTGTLTQDRIILERHVDVHGEENEHVLEYAYLNSYYQTGLKNLLDIAVLNHMEVHERLRVGTAYRKLDEVPFDFVRRRMSVVVAGAGDHTLICKGAVEEVFSVCARGQVDGQIFPLDESDIAGLKEVAATLNEDGFRVIAIAYRSFPVERTSFSVKDEADLILLGYIAFLDPPKDSAAAAIAVLNKHGVRVKILTGDNEVVTRKVCKEVGLHVDHIALGSELDVLTDMQLAELAETTSVFAKLSPAQKSRVITALHSKGHVVGFLGDGINDGPALKTADVGISVDTAVDIAKESADIILLEKSLMVLEEGVIEGRRVFGNIIKYIKMGASSNFGNMFSVLGASAFLPFLPMAPVQVLFNNLLYDFSQASLATDHVDDEYLLAPRRWEIGNIARFMLYIGPISSLFDYATFFALLFFFHAGHNAMLFQTGWFVESLLSQTLIVHVIRTGKVPFIQSRPSLPLALTSIAICVVGIVLPYSPFAGSFGFMPLPVLYWPALTFILLAYMGLTQLIKTWVVRKFGFA
jgi:P-type Mg2+ transporter